MVIELNPNASPQGKQASFIVSVSTVSSSAIGYTYARGWGYSCQGRVTLTVGPGGWLSAVADCFETKPW